MEEKELTPEAFLKNYKRNKPYPKGKRISDAEIEWLLREYTQREVDKKVNKFVEFCADNYSLEIPPRIIDDFKTTS